MESSRPSQVRKLRPTRRSVSGYYVFRGKASVAFESTLERDFIIQMEFDSSVEEVIPQPCEIAFTGNKGRRYTYTPDFLVYFRDAVNRPPMLVEVKPTEQWKESWRKWSEKWKTARRYAKEQGWQFRIMDDSRIRNQVLTNINYLTRYKRTAVSSDLTDALMKTVATGEYSSFGELLSAHANSGDSHQLKRTIWHLVANRKLDCDLSVELNDNTLLWISDYE